MHALICIQKTEIFRSHQKTVLLGYHFQPNLVMLVSAVSKEKIQMRSFRKICLICIIDIYWLKENRHKKNPKNICQTVHCLLAANKLRRGVNGAYCHFHQYLGYIVAVSFMGGGNRRARESHWPAASHWQTLSHKVVSSTPHLIGIPTHNVSGDRHWLHR